MARRRVSNFFCSFLLEIFILSSCGVSSQKDCKYDQLKSKELGIFHFPSRDLQQFFFPKETIHDKIEPPVIHPSPPNIPAPPVGNIPSPNPLITVTPNKTNVPGVNPSTTPVPVANTNITNSSPPPSLPSTNPVTQPVLPPPTTSNVPHNPGQSWCVAKSGAPQAALQAALDYACGVGGVDCSVVQQGGSCYNPVTLENHASYAFNSFYQRNPVPTSCDFGGTAMITNSNPSSGSCIFPTSSSTSTSSVPPPVTRTPTQTPPTPSAVPTLPAISTPPAAPTLPLGPTPPASPTPPAFPTPPASSAFPTPPASSASCIL
ncbi:hypothetical protein Leryth_018666 [Lithospermum erythrorhizon]|nr:hypothetical protein Leryth_018666 [Lithospermum erythrorhizon]